METKVEEQRNRARSRENVLQEEIKKWQVKYTYLKKPSLLLWNGNISIVRSTPIPSPLSLSLLLSLFPPSLQESVVWQPNDNGIERE